MGVYLDMSNKEQWLADHGTAIGEPDRHEDFGDGERWLAVCIVSNPGPLQADQSIENGAAVIRISGGGFSAAGIVYSERELHRWTDPTDHRPKQWYWVRERELHEVAPRLREYMEVQ